MSSAIQIQSPQANFSPQYLPWYTRIASFSMNSNEGALINSATGPFTITLPAAPAVGDRVAFMDIGGFCQTNIVTISRNGLNIQGQAQNLDLDISGGAFELLYTGATRGWTLKEFPAGAAALGSTLSYKNLLINGDFQLDQRNVGAAVSVTASGVFGPDRWRSSGQSADGVFSVQQVTSSVPATGAKYAYKITTTTADASIGAAQIYASWQIIEGQMMSHLMWGTANAKSVTLTFWVRSSLTGAFSGSLRNSASTRSYPFSYTVLVADTWEKKTIVIPGCTDGTWLTDNGIGCSLTLDLGVGTTYRGTAGAWASANYAGVTGAVSLIGTVSATLYLADVQFEAGELATDFERLPADEVLRRCQRYYCKSYRLNVAPGTTSDYSGCVFSAANSNGYFSTNAIFPAAMRSSPVCTIYNPETGATASIRSNVPDDRSAAVNSTPSNTSFQIWSNAMPSDGYGYAQWTADAEL
jgi:hypothetical protein